MLPNAITSASYGIQYNLNQLNAAADRIADPEYSAGIDEIVDLRQAELGIKINAAVLKTANPMSGYLVDMLV